MDAAEFDAFHAGTFPRLLASLAAATGDPDRAHEALEQAYARAWSRRGSLGRDEAPETSVLRTAAQLAGVDPSALPSEPPALEDVTAALGALTTRPRSAADVRELGATRSGRRRAAVVVAVVLGLMAGLVGVVQLLPGGPGGGPGPGPDNELEVNPTPRIERPGEVPEDFDLALGLSAEGRTGPGFDVDPFPGWEVCGRSYELAGLTSAGLGARSRDFGMESGRVLVVARELDLSDADLNAHGIAERYVSRFERCAREGDVTTEVGRTLVGDEGWTIVRSGPTGAREIVQVVRVGSAVLVSATRTRQGDAVALDGFSRAEAYAIAPVVARMCVWNDTGCPS